MTVIYGEAEMDIEIDEYLDDASTNAMLAELERRDVKQRKRVYGDFYGAKEVINILDESEHVLRKAGRIDLAFKLEEIRRML